MKFDFQLIKNTFFTIGSIAGVFAILKPLFESKFDRDKTRFNYISGIINEKMLINMEPCIYQSRNVPSEIFDALDKICYETEQNIDEVRFSGPLKMWYKSELKALCENYLKLREFIQVPEWEPHRDSDHSDKGSWSWRFNKSAFIDEDGNIGKYDKHLYDAAEQSLKVKIAYQKMQIISELHFLEFPFARCILPKRFKTLFVSKT